MDIRLCAVITGYPHGSFENAQITEALTQGLWRVAIINTWLFDPQADWDSQFQALVFVPGPDCSRQNMVIGFAAVATARARGCKALVLGGGEAGNYCQHLPAPWIEHVNQIVDTLESTPIPARAYVAPDTTAPATAPEKLYAYSIQIPGEAGRINSVRIECNGLAIEESGALVCVRAGRVVFGAAPGGWLNVEEEMEVANQSA